jgi:hypothetical protein
MIACQPRSRRLRVVTLLLTFWFPLLVQPSLAQNVRLFEDNSDSIGIVIGNMNYRQTAPVDFAHNDADAMRDFLSRSLGFRDSNIFVLKDATLPGFRQRAQPAIRPAVAGRQGGAFKRLCLFLRPWSA